MKPYFEGELLGLYWHHHSFYTSTDNRKDNEIYMAVNGALCLQVRGSDDS